MSREINVPYTIPQVINVTKIATIEEMTVICEYKDLNIVNVEVSLKTSDGEVLDKKNYSIAGSDYDLLMSQSPEFAPDKPENEYREIDLWYIIDKIRAEQQTNTN